MVVIRDRMGKPLTVNQAMGKFITRVFNIFLDFELMILRFVGHIPIHWVRRLLYRLVGIKIGKSSTIHMFANFYQPGGITIGEDTIVGDHAFLDGRARLIIGSHVAISSQVLIYNSQHDIHSQDFAVEYGEVNISNYVFIGPRVTILPGVHIGIGAVVAAGAVVTKDVDPFTIVAGVPAEKIGERKLSKPNYRIGRARLFQ
ncbi:acyltransferase [Candidatus Gottesmanbacteria bacterium]|nr:acyltransferase [Candidatus Gottesmanbacteria bacterium]